MSKAISISDRDLDDLWSRSEPDLELSDDGQIRAVRPKAPEGTGRAVSGALRAIGAAAPVAAGVVISSLEEIGQRWD